jgi:hypothetical protein
MDMDLTRFLETYESLLTISRLRHPLRVLLVLVAAAMLPSLRGTSANASFLRSSVQSEGVTDVLAGTSYPTSCFPDLR